MITIRLPTIRNELLITLLIIVIRFLSNAFLSRHRLNIGTPCMLNVIIVNGNLTKKIYVHICKYAN